MMDGWDWIWGTLMMLLFWGGLVAVIVFAVRAASGGAKRNPSETTDAETILANRFARGEISQEEFEEKRSVLHSRVA